MMTEISRRTVLSLAALGGGVALTYPDSGSASPVARTPGSISGVRVSEVADYAPGHYTGSLSPSPPHADMNAKKAVIVQWDGNPCRFVFSHEASYCPIFELPSGAGLCTQFFEGNLGEAELFNNLGRREKNSFVDVLQRGPDRVWVRWTYFAVNKDDDTQPRLRGTEDYFAYPNGLVLRRMSYQSLMPGAVVGYSTQPFELFGVLPQGALPKDSFVRDAKHGDYATLSVRDLYSDRHYDLYWDEKGGVRRDGDDATLAAINESAGYAMVIPFKGRLMFAILGTASGFPPQHNQLIDHCTPGALGGLGWGQGIWDHWPIGWLNSQLHDWKPGSNYSYHFGSIGQFFVPVGKRIESFWRDYSEFCKDMQANEWTANRPFHVLIGSAAEWSEVMRIGREWLNKGTACVEPDSVAGIRT